MADKRATPDVGEALREALRPMVRDVIVELLDEFKAGEPLKPELLTAEQICQALQISKATLRRRLIPAG